MTDIETPVKPHPHAELLRAIANGQAMQLRAPTASAKWTDCQHKTALKIISGDDCYDCYSLRVKPVEVIVTLYTNVERKPPLNRVDVAGFAEVRHPLSNLALTFQGDELVDAAVL